MSGRRTFVDRRGSLELIVDAVAYEQHLEGIPYIENMVAQVGLRFVRIDVQVGNYAVLDYYVYGNGTACKSALTSCVDYVSAVFAYAYGC